MSRQPLEVADIFRDHGPAWRRTRAGRLSLGALKVMSAIEHCRTAALGGHVTRCEACEHTEIAYNSCRNRHCPKCQGAVAKRWLAAREAELLPVAYFHVVFTVPAAIGDIIVLLSPTPKPLSDTDSGHRRPATARQRCKLTRSRRAHLQSAPVHTNPGDDAILKSP